jgi:acetyl esterase
MTGETKAGGDWAYPAELSATAQASLEFIAELAAGMPGLAEISAEEAQRLFNPLSATYSQSMLTGRAVITRTSLPLPGGTMDVHTFDAAPGTPQPLFIFVHGGGWVLLRPDAFDHVCEDIAVALGCKVVSLDYPLAPQAPCPKPLDACVEAVRYLKAHGAPGLATVGPTFIGGDSAGANLSLGTLLRLKGDPASPDAGVLYYGVFDNDHSTRSHQVYGGGAFYLSTADMDWYWQHYTDGAPAEAVAEARSMHADLSGLPPLFLAAAELDPLRDDSPNLADKLGAAGIRHELHLIKGALHGCINFAKYYPEVAATHEAVARFLGRPAS